MSQRRAKQKVSKGMKWGFGELPKPTPLHVGVDPAKPGSDQTIVIDSGHFFTKGELPKPTPEHVEALTIARETESEAPFMHVDDFIDAYNTDAYASFCFALFRFPAVVANKCAGFIERFQLYCRYKGEGFRVTGASRMGDVWLTRNFDQDTGYQLRVNVADCSDWSPNRP